MDKGSELIPQISGSLISIDIRVTNVFPKSQWTRYVIHGIPSTIGNKYSVQLSATIATEIKNVTSLTLAQRLRWLSIPNGITCRGSGTIIVSLPGKVETIGLTILYLFNRRCGMEKARLGY